MLNITIPGAEAWDEATQEFCYTNEVSISLEHSLVSLSKWESKWNKPFLVEKTKTDEEILDYIKCMTLTPNVSDDAYNYLSEKNIKDVQAYIEAPMTATTISDTKTKGKSSYEVPTSELIYYWMIASNIPFECQHWHLNRLLTLIKVCAVKSQPSKKMSKREIMSRNAAINAARKKQLNTRG